MKSSLIFATEVLSLASYRLWAGLSPARIRGSESRLQPDTPPYCRTPSSRSMSSWFLAPHRLKAGVRTWGLASKGVWGCAFSRLLPQPPTKMRIAVFAMRVGGLSWRLAAQDSIPAISNLGNAEYPRITSDLRVTFRLKAPNAQKVQLRGDSGLIKDSLDLARGDDGIWSVTTLPAAPRRRIEVLPPRGGRW